MANVKHICTSKNWLSNTRWIESERLDAVWTFFPSVRENDLTSKMQEKFASAKNGLRFDRRLNWIIICNVRMQMEGVLLHFYCCSARAIKITVSSCCRKYNVDKISRHPSTYWEEQYCGQTVQASFAPHTSTTSQDLSESFKKYGHNRNPVCHKI